MLLVGALAAPAVAAGDGVHMWTRQLGTTGNESINGVAVHPSGVYAGGYTSGNLKGTNLGGGDGFVRKHDHDGKHLWTRQFGTPEWEEVRTVAAHSTGVYAAGYTQGNLQGTSKGDGDGFVRKYDHDGQLLWTRQFGTDQWEGVLAVAVDATGVYAAGYTQGNLQGTNKGSSDAFVRKYDHDGQLLWTRQFGTPVFDAVYGIAVDGTGVYAAGRTDGSLKGTSKGAVDGFIRKYDHDGKRLWTRQFGTPYFDAVYGIAADGTGVYAAGVTDGSLKGVAKGEGDGFVRAYDPNGKHLWSRQFGTPQPDTANGVAVDATGVYVVGYTDGNLKGINKGQRDGLVRAYDPSGKHLWSRQFGTAEADTATGVAVHSTGVYGAGWTEGSLKGTNKGKSDGFVRKYGTG
jgi:antitoxin component YwqK of YwqJK toxin-antitoxin module